MEDSVTENEKLQQVVLSSVHDEDEKEAADAKEMINNGDIDVEEKGAVGFINQIISSFTPGGEQQEEKDNNNNNKVSSEESEEGKKGGEGGLFSHIISSLVSSPLSSPRARDDGKQPGDDLFDNSKTPEKDGSGGKIDKIVSNLPTPLPDDAAPASDEASMLIHSIIHD